MKKLLDRVSSLLPIHPVALVTSVGKDNNPNIMTVGSIAHISNVPPTLGIGVSPTHLSYVLIEETKDFVVNFPTADLLWETDFIGTGGSGREIDKFEVTGLTPIEATKVRSPLIKECPLNLECILRERLVIGAPKDHDWLVGEVVATHVDEEIMNEKGNMDLNKARVIAFGAWNEEYWDLGKRLGDRGLFRKASNPRSGIT